jgi:hypothetical protein
MSRKVEVGTGGVDSSANKTMKNFVGDIFTNKKQPVHDPEKEKVKFTFTVTVGQYEKVEKWLDEQNVKAVEIQRKKHKNPDPIYEMCWEMGLPYCGAIGGEVSYEFSPTSLGDCLVVKHAVTKEELNITDYGAW